MACFLSQVPDLVVHEEEVYEDEDDENEEGNWRNDYPDEESDPDSDREERYGGMCRSNVSVKCAESLDIKQISSVFTFYYTPLV